MAKPTKKHKRGGKSKATGIPGRRTCFNPLTRSIIELLARRGFTDVEMSQCLKIKEQTFTNWKKKHPKFFGSLNDWKTKADSEVVRSLYERACGYEHPEDKIFNNNGKPLIVPTIKHYPPDSTAMIFWLKNRDRKNWRDRHEIDIPDDANLASLVADMFNKGKNGKP